LIIKCEGYTVQARYQWLPGIHNISFIDRGHSPRFIYFGFKWIA